MEDLIVDDVDIGVEEFFDEVIFGVECFDEMVKVG